MSAVPPSPRGVQRSSRTLLRRGLPLLALVLLAEWGARVVLANESVLGALPPSSSVAWKLKWIVSRPDVEDGAVEHDPELGWVVDVAPRVLPSPATTPTGSRSPSPEGSQSASGTPPPIVVATGDTDCEGVPWTRTLAAELADAAEVVDLGAPGYGDDQALLALRRWKDRLTPDLVLVPIVADGPSRNLLHFRDLAKPKFEPTGARLSLRHSPVPPPEQLLRSARLRPRLLDAFDLVRDLYSVRVGLHARKAAGLSQSLRDALTEEAVEMGAIVAFLWVPSSDSPSADSEGRLAFEDYCASRAAFCIDPEPAPTEARSAASASCADRVTAALVESFDTYDLLNLATRRKS